MRYLGGKSKIAKRIAERILQGTPDRERLIEPFIGGGAMTAVLAPYFKTGTCSDQHADLILMWQALQKGWLPPERVSEGEYVAQRNASPSALRGFVGYGCSWGGKWFGGYASGDGRNYASESRRALLRDIERMKNVGFAVADYRHIDPRAGDVVYCDPPYDGTTQYRDQFNSQEFWNHMNAWCANGADVFVSEYVAPATWAEVWSLERARDLKSKRTNTVKVTERLFHRGNLL